MAGDLFDVLRGAAPAAPFVVIKHPGPPVPKGRPRFRVVPNRSFVHVYTPAKTKAYEEALQWRARAAMKGRPPLTGPIAVRCFAMVPIPKSWPERKRDAALHPISAPDFDNYAKAAFDAMNAIVFEDDAQIVRALIVKEYAEKPGLIVEIYTL